MGALLKADVDRYTSRADDDRVALIEELMEPRLFGDLKATARRASVRPPPSLRLTGLTVIEFTAGAKLAL